MAGTIRMTPREIEAGAKILDSKLSAITTEVNAMKKKIDEIAGGWDGQAKEKFMSIWNDEIFPVLNKTLPDAVTSYSEGLKSAAKIMDDTDKQLAGIG